MIKKNHNNNNKEQHMIRKKMIKSLALFPRIHTQPYISPLYTIEFVHNITRTLKGK